MKIKFPSYVTRKIYRFLITLNSQVTQLENLNFTKNSKLRNSKILFKKNPSYYFNKYTTIYGLGMKVDFWSILISICY